MTDLERAFSTFEAELIVHKAMLDIPSGDGPVLPLEFRQLVRVRKYLGNQTDIALKIKRNCSICAGGEGGVIEVRDPVSGDWAEEDCPCCGGCGAAPADRIADFERQRDLGLVRQPIVDALDNPCAEVEQ